jgi:S-adenosylmethionine uptake transporter
MTAVVLLLSAPMSLSPATRAALWMLTCAASFAFTLICIRKLAHLGAIEILLFRIAVGLILMTPWLGRRSLRGFRLGRPMHWLAVAAFLLTGQATWNWAIARIPLAEGTALNFTLPLFVTLFAILMLKEPATRMRIFGLLVGFAGVLVILRPGWIAITGPALAAIGCAIAFAASDIAMKLLVRTVPADLVTFNFYLLMLPVVGAASLPGWTTPALADLPWALAIGAFGTLSYLSLMRAFALADAGAVMAYDFARLPFAAVAGALAFGERPDAWTWVGAAIIFGAAYAVSRAERRAGEAA